MTVETAERESVTKQIGIAVRHSAVYGLGSMVAKALGFLMLPFYTHYLKPSDYGVLEILDLSMSLLGMFLNMGMTAALLRRYASAESETERKRTVSTAFLFVAVTGVLTFVIVAPWVRSVSAMLLGPHVPATYLWIAFASFTLSYIANLPRTFFRALEASGTFVLVDTVSLFLMLMLNVYFIAGLRLGLAGILLSSLIVVSLQVVVLSAWTLRQVGFGFSTALLRDMVAFGLPLIFSNLAMFALNFSDRFFLQHLGSLELVGIYAVGYKFAFMINYLLVQPFYVMWQSRMYAIERQPDSCEVLRQIFSLYSLLLAFAALALALFSPEVVRIMVGPEFAASRAVIPIVALAYVLYGIGYYMQAGMFLADSTSLIGVVSAAAAVLNLGLNYILIASFGMIGAAWATLLSFAAIAAGSYWFSQRVYPLPLPVGRVGGAILMGAAIFVLGSALNSQSLPAAVFGKVALLACFPMLLWKFRMLSPAEIATIASMTHNLRRRLARLGGLFPRKALTL